MHRALCIHGDFFKTNMMSMFSITIKVHENEHQCISQNVVIMETLMQ